MSRVCQSSSFISLRMLFPSPPPPRSPHANLHLRRGETVLQLNSLFNPVLCWYRNRPLRETELELVSCIKRPAACTTGHIRSLQNEQRGAGLLRSESDGTMILRYYNVLRHLRHRRYEAVKERLMSAPLKVKTISHIRTTA